MTEGTGLKRALSLDCSPVPSPKQALSTPPAAFSTLSVISPQGWAKAIVSIPRLGSLLEDTNEDTELESEVFRTGDGKEWQIVVRPYSQGQPTIGIYIRLCSELQAEIRQTVNYTLEVYTNSAETKLVREVMFYHKSTFSAENLTAGYPSALPHSKYRPKFPNTCFIDLVLKPTTFSKESKQRTHCVGLVNEGTTCYLNSLLQTFYFISQFRRAVYNMPVDQSDSESIPLALQRVFYHLQYDKDAVATKELLESFGWGVDEFNTQHDVQEFNCTLSACLERKMKNTASEGTFSWLFEGTMVNFIKCDHVDYTSTREEKFLDLQLNVKGLSTLYDSFDKYVEVETLTGDNQYDAETFGRQDAKKGIKFRSFPPVLQLQLKRFEYNFQTDSMHKVNDHFSFPAKLDLNRYTASPADYSYTLFSILVHTGSANAGHYFAFLRPDCGKWLKFDDEVVETALEEYAFLSSFGGEFRQLAVDEASNEVQFTSQKNDMSAYMLVYIQDCRLQDTLQSPILHCDIPQQLHTLFTEEEEEREKVKQTEILQTQMCSVYFVAFQMIRGWNRPGITTSESEFSAGNATFKHETRRRLKLVLPKSLKVRDLRQMWKKKYNLAFLRFWTFTPGFRNWEFKEAKDDDDLKFALCSNDSQTKAVFLDFPKEVALFKPLAVANCNGELWEFNEDLLQAPPQEPKVESGYMLRSQEGIPVFLKWFFCDETGPHIRLVGVMSQTPSLTMNQARALILKDEHIEGDVQLNLYHEKCTSEAKSFNVRLYNPPMNIEMTTRIQQPLGHKYIKLDPGDALIGEIPPLKPADNYEDARNFIESMQDLGTLVCIHRDKFARPMISTYGKSFMDQHYRDSRFAMDAKLSWTVRETMESVATELREFDATLTWEQVQLYSFDESRRVMNETAFPLPEENSISPRSKRPITLAQLMIEPNFLHFDLLEFPIGKVASGLMAQVLLLDENHCIQKQINAVASPHSTVSDLKLLIWPQLKEQFKCDPGQVVSPDSVHAYLMQAYSRHYIYEVQDSLKLDEVLLHSRYQLVFRLDPPEEDLLRTDSDHYFRLFGFHNYPDFRQAFSLYVSVSPILDLGDHG